MIKIEHLRKEFETETPLIDVNAEIKKGEIISVIGPSGTGKSTFLRCLNLLETPTSGKIFIGDEEITLKDCKVHLLRRKMGMVFQSFNLFNNKTIIENVMAAPIKILKKSKEEAYKKGMELLRLVGLSDKADSFPDELSGGQKQRAAIARTLAMDPEIILFDEPTSALDPTMVGEVLQVIRKLAKKGLTMIIVTHEMNFAKEISTRVFFMNKGIIYEEGTPEEIFDNPEKDLTRQFIRQLKVLTLNIDSADYDFVGINTEIEKFGRKQMMDQMMINRIQNLYEEICVIGIINHIKDNIHFEVSLEYSEQNQKADVIIKYNGKAYNPIEHADEISFSLVKNHIENGKYEVINEEIYTNLIRASIKK